RPEVVVRSRFALMVAIVLAAFGMAAGVTGSPPVAAASGPCGTTTTPHAYQHVIWIWMENHSFGDIIGNSSQAPYINSLAAECGLATNYHVTTPPTLPNYLSATSGLPQASLPVLSFLDYNVS